ncbi:unnamed protein product [Aureobasidium mustum]|uniref:Aldehyde dehydrogenase domain-containing protein n=1 Tax=Aureobasidium mustum TaxID=2773714 RepID=A0A9N8K1J7_9PEZI|nr:unnamed protein product [Aureobasidium mustum]
MEEALDWVSENQSTVALTWVAVVFATAVLWFATKGESEAAVDFEVPLPKQCGPGWQGEVLQEPSLKISGSSAVQCYCPATGQLLGVINPSTPDGIDRAIARAQEAQRTWALTTFSQRRKVLRTLLK